MTDHERGRSDDTHLRQEIAGRERPCKCLDGRKESAQVEGKKDGPGYKYVNVRL